MNLIAKAQNFAHAAHDSIKQVRKYSGEPYWVHTDAVAAQVASVGGTEEMVAAAHLHDYREDVVTRLQEEKRFAELEAFELEYNTFPQEVRDYVTDLTDVYTKAAYPKLNRKERHALENKRLALVSDNSKTIKLADLINNTESIVAEDVGFARVYLAEKLELLPLLTEGHPALLNQASVQTVAGCAAVGVQIPWVQHS